MSYLLDSVNQIRFPAVQGPFGWYTLIINRPGTKGVGDGLTNTLLLARVTDPTEPLRISPYIEGDIPLSKKFTTTVGRRALDDSPISIRDSVGYTGTVNGVFQSEQFDADYVTFFDVWFGSPLGENRPAYQALILSENVTGSGTVLEVSHIGYIDPTYNPSTNPEVFAPGTANQIWIGTRTVKVTALSQAQTNLTWRSILQPYDAVLNPFVPSDYTGITSGDCQPGVPYNGFMYTPPGCQGKSNTRADCFSSSTGYWMQATPHLHINTGNPIMVGLPAPIWPSAPLWATDQISGTIAQIAPPLGVFDTHLYSVGDTGTILLNPGDPGYGLGAPLATYIVTEVYDSPPFQLVYITITSGGSGYAVDTSLTNHLTTTSGSGTGLFVVITKVMSGSNFGPSGLVFISLATLFAKISDAMDLGTFGSVESALDFFLQKASTSGGEKCFPLDTTALALDNLYISLNVFAGSHPYDGSYWNTPVTFAIDGAILDVITGICNFLLADFNETYSTVGVETLQLTAMGTTSGSVPDSWEIIGVPSIEDPTQGPTNAIVQYVNDSMQIQCPTSDKGQSSNISIPIRLHRIGSTSGLNPVPDLESSTWDGTDPTVQADNCFKIAWTTSLTDNTGLAINPDCWKGLCYLYSFDSAGTAAVYPSNWEPFPKADGSSGSWSNSFYVVNAEYKSGSTPPANLQNAPKGNDYFNARCYQAVAFAALTLNNGTVQTFQYSGISDDSGSVQAITSGMAGTWRLAANASQNWRGIQVDQGFVAGTSTIKYQAIGSSGAFPLLTDLAYGAIAGAGTSSTTGGNTSSGGIPNGNNPVAVWSVVAVSITANTDNLPVALATPDVYLQLSGTAAYNMTGIISSANCVFLKIRNTGTHIVTLKNLDSSSAAANRFSITGGDLALRPGQTIEFIYDSLWVCTGAY